MKKIAMFLTVVMMFCVAAIPVSAAEVKLKVKGNYADNKMAIELRWNEIEGAEVYKIQRKEAADKKYTTLIDTTILSSTSYYKGALPTKAGKYTYRVVTKVDGEWIYSNKLSVTIKKPHKNNPPSEPETSNSTAEIYDISTDPTCAEDYVFPYNVGEMPGQVSEYIEEYKTSCNMYANKRFREIYGYSILKSNLSMGLLDYVDADGVIKLYKASEYKADPTLYEKSKEYLENYGTTKLITDINAIPNRSVAVFKAEPAVTGEGHYVFIEYVERDKNGNPLNVYYTDAGGTNYEQAGKIQKITWNEFLNYGNSVNYKFKGYLIPYTFPKD